MDRIVLSVLLTWTMIFVPCRAIIMSPPYGTCWDNLSFVALTEITAIFNPNIPLSTQRTYVLCSQHYVIGNMDELTGILLDGQYPIVAFNPNMHIVCEKDDKSCILSGGQFQVFSLTDQLLQGILPSLPLHGYEFPPELPDDHAVDISNLLFEGIVFENSYEVTYGANVRLTTPGTNIQFLDCVWQQVDNFGDDTMQQDSAVSVDLANTRGAEVFGGTASVVNKPVSSRLISIMIKDSVFKDLRKRKGIVSAIPTQNGDGLFEIKIDGCLFTNNKAPSLVEIASSNRGSLKRSCFTSNHIESRNIVALYNTSDISFKDLFEEGNEFTGSEMMCTSSKDASLGILSLASNGDLPPIENRVDHSCEVAFKATSCIRESSDDDDDAFTSSASPPITSISDSAELDEASSQPIERPAPSPGPTDAPISNFADKDIISPAGCAPIFKFSNILLVVLGIMLRVDF